MTKELQNTWDILVSCSEAGYGSRFTIIAADELIKAQQEQNADLLNALKTLTEDIKQKHNIHLDNLIGVSTRDALLKALEAIAKAEGGL